MSLDDLTVGEHNFTIVVRDQSGLFTTDGVSVLVVADPVSQILPVTLILGAVVVVAGLVVILRRR